jgi:CheY-like chemotaxis protein
MRGKILNINIADNTGILSDEEGNELPFSLDDCVCFEDTPFVGELVKFGLNSGEIFFVEPLSQEYKDTQTVHTTSKYQEDDIPIEFIEPKKKKAQVIQLNIPVTVSLKQCIDDYFQDIEYSIGKYEAQFEDYEELDYILMKRFLNTAYNNLSDMDSTFMDEELLELRSDLLSLDSVYTKLIKKDSVPIIAYEKLFLERQVVYKTNKKRLDTNSSEIFTMESSVKSLEKYIQELETSLKTAPLTPYKNEQINDDLKRHRTYYVDILHKMANLKAENIKLKDSLQSFEKKYEEEFLGIFEEESKKKYAFLKRQLDGYAYVFDQKLWEKAEKSAAIITFFKKAHIKDEFSSKTFLKYFIKSLDEMKMSKELKKLQELLWYLESRAKLRILIVEENLKEKDTLKHIIRSFDKDYSVDASDKPRSVYYMKNLKDMDLIFVDYSIKNPNILEFLEMLKARIKQTKSSAVLCVISKVFQKEVLLNLKRLHIENVIALNTEESELKKNLKNLIDTVQSKYE